MDILSTFVNKTLEDAVNQLKQEATCLFFYKSHVENLNDKIKELHNAKVRVEHQVESEERKGKEIEMEIKNWLENVQKIIEKCEQKNIDHAIMRCFNGLFPNPWSMYSLGKQALKMAQEVDELQKNSKLDGFSWLGPVSIDFALFTAGYKPFSSRKKTIDDVKEKLKDSSVRIIGVYGQGGVGKTTLVKNVASEVRDMFKMVVVASVTRNPDRKKIQGAIADVLGLRLEEESEIGRANRIQERLKKEKENTLIILDDLWDGLDLNELGILVADDVFSQKMTTKVESMPNLDYNMAEEKEQSPTDQRMIKILLTSRSKDVLSSQMSVDENSIFPIGLLNDMEAEILFKTVAKILDKSSEFESFVSKIVKKCKGLPIAITTIGKALKGKSQHEWDDAIQQFERKGLTGMSESLEFSTRLSFNSLENEELKSAFLLCAQMGDDPLAIDLMKYCYGLSVLQGVHTIKEARDRTLGLIKRLKDLSLLADSTFSDHFNMHDMIRDAALSISAKERHAFVMRDEKLDEWPDEDELEKFSSISLCNCCINDDLPEGATFPKLKFFHINSSHPFVKIPNNFKGVTKLKVVILTDIPLPHLPFSNGSIINSLRMLCLERCLLSDTNNLSIIGELQKLRILSFSGSQIERLPSELGKLSNLQWFDISNCSQLRVIPPNVLSRLHSLEELYMRDSPIQWGSEGQPNCKIQNATLVELSHLHQLTNLDVCISDATVFPKNMFLGGLESYKIVIGDPKLLSKEDFTMPKKYEASRALVLQLKEGMNIHTHKGIKMLLRRVEKLWLGELHDINNAFYELNLEGFQYLKYFCIQNTSDIECIIDSKMSYPQDAFPKLESLCLYNLEKLKTICRIKLTDPSFGNLKSIKIKDCPQLKNIFPISIIRLLKKLETFEVCYCDSLKDMVVREENTNNDKEVDSKIEFPQLRSLTLQSLPAFCSFYSNGINTCSSIIFNEVEIPKLETLELASINNQIQKIWMDQTPPSSCLKNLIKLNVEGCNGLTYLFSFSEAKNLGNLKTISVSKCDKMEKILNPEDISLIKKKVCIFPKLEEINLNSMMSLKAIWHPQEVRVDPFSSLSSVIIKDCEKLVTVFPPHMVGHFPHLEKLKIVRCSSVKEIFDLNVALQNNESENETNLRFVEITGLQNLKHVWNQDPKGILSFKNMQRIEVYRCDELENLFPTSFANDLENLDYLRIVNCPELHEISWKEGPDTNVIPFKFPRLTSVTLAHLPKLKNFYQRSHTLECPSLKKLTVVSCDKLEVFPIPTETKNLDNRPIFLPEEVISNLEFMDFSQKEAERLHHYVDSHLMHRLKELHFNSLPSNAILYKILHRIPNLEKLILLRCHMTELLPSKALDAHEKIGTVIQIKDLNLTRLHDLVNIGFEHDPVLQMVERVSLSWCMGLRSLAPSTISFTHLQSLEVSHCDKLLNLMGSSTAKSLVKLTNMKVTHFKEIREIVAKERNEEERVEEHEIVFRKLMRLELVSLPKLTSFCNCNNHNLNFPALEKLRVIECPTMKIFCESLATAPILREVSLAFVKEDKGKWLWEYDLNAIVRKFSTDMVFLEDIQRLELRQYPKLERVWHGQDSLRDNYFCNLKMLDVANCDFLSSAIPFHLLAYLKNLEELRVSNCSLVEVIFDMNDIKMTKTGGKAYFLLKTLRLLNLPNLKHVWNRDPQGRFGFHNLQDVFVQGCKRLKTLFPKSVAERLGKLDRLHLIECRALEEIIGKEDAAADGEFEFPRLTKLRLIELPELKCTYPMKLKCPTLNYLFVYRCGRLETFTQDSQSYEEAAPFPQDQNISIEAGPPFSIQKVIPILTGVALKEKDYNMLWHGGLQANLDNLKYLWLECFHNVNETDHLPYEILRKVPNIELLVVLCSDFKEIYFSQIQEDCHVTMPSELKRLQLHDLPRLISIGSEHFFIDPVLNNLNSLEVSECPCLTKLIHSSTSFSNLKKLKIGQCHGLVYLFTSSIAKSLVQLEEIYVRGCESIKEIVAEDRDELDSADGIMFENLKRLWLSSLSSLTSFYLGNSTLKLPYLQSVTIIRCLRMKTFSNSIIETQNLREITVSNEGNAIPLRGDLNSTVGDLFNQKLQLAFMKYLKLSDFPELQELWLGETPLPANCFSKLTTLVVENCEFLFVVIPSYLLAYLKNLEELRVQNCSVVEVIFDINGMETTETEELAFFLEKLTLDQLPNLKLVWNKNPKRILSLEKLQKVEVSDCGSLQYLFPAASMARHLLELKVQNCGALMEILGKEDIIPGASEILEFPYLTTMVLNHLPELNCFYPERLCVKCPMIKVLNVYHCGKLEMFTSETKTHLAISDDQVGVPVNAPPIFTIEEVTSKLEEVSLNEKETMTSLLEDVQANCLHNIKCLQFYCFHRETDQEDTLPYGILHKVPNLEILAVACSDFKEILPSRGLKDEHIRMLSKLKGLQLEALPKLNSVGLEHHAVSFSNLEELSVTKCHRLVYLFTSSTAGSLVQLRRISIKKCEAMREIVAKEEKESTEDDLLFGELTKLSLNDLPNLQSFYAGNSTMRFPYLQEAIIAKCSKMNVFSEGIISAPQLPYIKVSLEKRDVRWEGDLNSTMKKLFKGKEATVSP